MVFVFTTFCDKLLVAGFATALIQKKDAGDVDFSSVFFFSFFSAIVLYVGLFFVAPLISEFYSNFDKNTLVNVLRVMGLSLFVMALNSVQHAYASKHMLFKRYFWSTLGGTTISSIIGVIMAFNGYGVWALVAQNLIMSSVDCLILFVTVRWRPILSFSWTKLKVLFSFGWKIFVASFIKMIYNDIRSLVIGKIYTPADLAFYNRGQSLPQLLDSNITGTIDSVLFPAYSKLQDNKDSLVNALRRAIKTSCYILMPMLSIMAAVSHPLVSILLTDKWLPCVVYMQILCFSFIFHPVEIENLQAIKAIGRSDIVLKLEIIKKVVGVILLVASIPFGLKAIAISMLLSCFFSAAVNALPNKKLLGYSVMNQISDILPSIIMSLVVFIFSALTIKLMVGTSVLIQLIVSLTTGAVVYVLLSELFKVEGYNYIKNIAIEIILRKNNNK